MCDTTAQIPIARRRPPGFRFSVTDAVAIAVVIAATVLLHPALGRLAYLFPVVLFHFFLFCNLFRVRRGYELTWAAFFIANFAGWSLAGSFTWPHVLVVQTPVTLAVLVAEIRSSRYHGIGYARINPHGQFNPLEVQP